MPNDARQRMIDSTTILLAKHGLSGTSFSDVLAASGAPRGSLYHHFPGGKDQLVLAAVGVAGDRAIAVLDRLEGKPAVEVARAFLDLWRSVLTVSDFGAGCAIAAVTVASDSPEMLESAGTVFRGWRTRLAELFAEGGVPTGRSAALATTLIASSEGAVVLSRAERSFEPFELVAAEQLATIAAAVMPGLRAAE
jgi:TetR/AcrR family transcriptional regulator, lmrAB and yxaGH operons repressor